MGVKPSNVFQMDRPESGGSDRDDVREQSGLLEREKRKFAADQASRSAQARQSSAPADGAKGTQRSKRGSKRSPAK